VAQLRIFDDPRVYRWIRENTPFDPDSRKGAGVSRDSRWNYHCFLTPEDYLDLTSTTREDLLGRDKGHLIEEYADAMEAMMAEGDGQFPVPWLQINWQDEFVSGHEGRHRAAAAWMLKLPAIPVVLVLRPKAYELTGEFEGEHVRGEEAVSLVQRLDETGVALLEAQQYHPSDPVRHVFLRFRFPDGRRARGYQKRGR
jgi:hypothetical protein